MKLKRIRKINKKTRTGDLDLGLALALRWHRRPALSLSTVYLEATINPSLAPTPDHNLSLIEDNFL